MITSREFWNKRSQIYDDQVGQTYREAYERTAALTLKYLSPSDRVLEFACGTGAVTFQVAPHVAQIRAIDISDEMVRRAKEKAAALGTDNEEISQTELFDPCLEAGGYDAVMAFNVLCYVEDRPQVLRRIHSLLRPGGLFLSATDCLGGRPTKMGLKKWIKSHTGAMPYVAFDTMAGLERAIAGAGFQVLERENLFPAPPNLFVAAKKIRCESAVPGGRAAGI